MNALFSKLAGRADALAELDPILALFLGAALLAVFLVNVFQPNPGLRASPGASLVWTLYDRALRVLWAAGLVLMLVGVIWLARSYLRSSYHRFQLGHGRVTDANFNAVQTIWGSAQMQPELGVILYKDEEVTERIESEDLSKPALLRKKVVRRFAQGNPFIQARHAVTLVQNARKKGSAFYGGYETECQFSWVLKSPAQETFKADLNFPLPAAEAVFTDLTVTLNGEDMLPRMEIRDASLALKVDWSPGETFNLKIAFKSRGLTFWYFQVREAREVRDFVLTLTLPDLAVANLNYPEGCMTPTQIEPTADGKGSVLAYRLDHALSNKGMGVALPDIPQPGAVTKAVLSETERIWMLHFSVLILSLTLLGVTQAVPVAAMFGSASALAYGLVGDLSDLLFGFWGTAALVLVPLWLLLTALMTRTLPGVSGRFLAGLYLVLGLVYPCLAGLDPGRQSLYFDLGAVLSLALVSRWLISRLRLRGSEQ